MQVMSRFTKSTLLLILDHLEEVHSFLNICSIFAVHENAPEILHKSSMSYLNKQLDLELFAKELERKNFEKIVKMHEYGEELLLRDAYTMISEYCRINNHTKKLQDQSWYHFARIIRNYVTHGILNSDNYKNVDFPVTWNDNVITKNNVQRSDIDLKRQFTYGFQLDLFNEMKQFANTLPCSCSIETGKI